MALDLKTQYSYVNHKDFSAKIVAALAKTATDIIKGLVDASPQEPLSNADKAKIRFARTILDSDSGSVVFVARALISQGLNPDTIGDSQLQNTITTYFDVFVTMFAEGESE